MNFKDVKKEIIATADGSCTVQICGSDVTYHSRHGAVQESMHVFIEAGLYKAIEVFETEPLHIFEMGFGTGLNALLTAMEAAEKKLQIQYTTLELYPLQAHELNNLNFFKTLCYNQALFEKLHHCAWNSVVPVSDFFEIEKIQTDLLTYVSSNLYHVIYYDAFAPSAQPELWTETVFKKLYNLLQPKGILVTYCSKSIVRRAMIAAGFAVSKIPGPRGKREMLRAEKI